MNNHTQLREDLIDDLEAFDKDYLINLYGRIKIKLFKN